MAAIDVVIPVYNAPDDLARCVESVLAHTQRPYRLILIDDGSPDERIAHHFAALARRALPHVSLLSNERNLGFIAAANRGTQLSRADVVLLNSDTVVTAGWLDALARCAASDPRIGTITPFSNNAEICSFPRFCVDNPWSAEDDPEPIRAALARAAVPTYPDLPTGVGFCFYIRRNLIDAIGTFDPAFGLGYGEENDFCLRAASAGYRNVLCDDAFVLHLGGRSFEERKAELGQRNLALLLERHPGYADLVRNYIATDPLRPLRDAALAQFRAATGSIPGVLHVVGARGGATEHPARSLIDASRGECRHYVAAAAGDDWRVEEHLDGGGVRRFELRRRPDESWPAFVGGICATFRIGFVHLHDLSGCRDGIIAALDALGLPQVTPGASAREHGCGLPASEAGAWVGIPSPDDGVPAVASLEPARVRDALGYVAWTPPRECSDAQARGTTPASPRTPETTRTPAGGVASESVAAQRFERGALIARTALRLRQTLAGHLLYRLTPARVRRALKSLLR